MVQGEILLVKINPLEPFSPPLFEKRYVDCSVFGLMNIFKMLLKTKFDLNYISENGLIVVSIVWYPLKRVDSMKVLTENK